MIVGWRSQIPARWSVRSAGVAKDVDDIGVKERIDSRGPGAGQDLDLSTILGECITRIPVSRAPSKENRERSWCLASRLAATI